MYGTNINIMPCNITGTFIDFEVRISPLKVGRDNCNYIKMMPFSGSSERWPTWSDEDIIDL